MSRRTVPAPAPLQRGVMFPNGWAALPAHPARNPRVLSVRLLPLPNGAQP